MEELLGDASKAREKLNWVPKVSLEELVDEMIQKDNIEAEKESLLRKKGFETYKSKE